MRLSRFFLPILRETPKEAEIMSHRLLLRADNAGLRLTGKGIAWGCVGPERAARRGSGEGADGLRAACGGARNPVRWWAAFRTRGPRQPKNSVTSPSSGPAPWAACPDHVRDGPDGAPFVAPFGIRHRISSRPGCAVQEKPSAIVGLLRVTIQQRDQRRHVGR